MTYDIVYQPTISYINLRYPSRISTYDIVYQPTISYINLQYCTSTYDIVYRPTISYTNLRCRISTYDIVYPSYQPCDCHQPYSSKRKQSVSPNMPPTPLKRGRSLGQKEGPKRWICGAHERRDVCGRGNPASVWMPVHGLKLGKVVDEIAEHFVEKCVRWGILIPQLTVC